ncbi:hypothetical protein L1047_15345 [Synechococcus sp. Nb3U1]|uniref:hypothetical protein n=1 Tax=Synechococcus sp. Nb3U1 TaxID=1914529 RepID=UPI001F2B8B6A|nr:hypothetical protein [Synechococcus sp. Nb3U1]MCF2972570.1 hypothetical protein [Synechococcus sp. Nb3U1]
MGFPLSPLIRYTIQALYWALVLPLPMLLSRQADPVWVGSLLVALLIGWGLLLGSLSQQVNVDDQGMRATYPAWVPAFLRQEWQVQWSDVERIEPRSTSQGGVVYYWVTQAGDCVLLPMRVAGFKRLLAEVQRHTGIQVDSLRPYVQPWMYALLGFFALLLLAWDGVIALLVWTSPATL